MPDSPATTQDPAAVITYLDDWTAYLTGLGLTITTATVTATNGAIITNTTPIATGVRFRLTTSAVATVPSIVTVTTTATLSNADVDVRHYQIQVSYT